MASHTVGAGTTLSTGYTITTGDGNGFALTNDGVIGAAGAAYAVVVYTTGDVVTNSGKIFANTVVGKGVFSDSSVRVTNNTGGTINAGYGINLYGGGSISNASGALITGVDPIRASNNSVSVSNYGVIIGTGSSSTRAGVLLNAGGYVYNHPNASISGANGVIEGVFAKVRNEGTITGNNAVGVLLDAGGTVTLETETPNSAATISGSYGGISITGGTGYVLDASGQISGGVAGVFLQSGGYIHQIGGPGGGPGGGVITAAYAVAINNGTGTVDTGGKILGTQLGVGMDGAGPHKVTLAQFATISGAKAISLAGGSGYIYTRGTIDAGTSGTAILMAGGYNNLLEIYSGAKIIGNVNGGNFQDGPHTTTLLLAQSGGTLTGFGNRYYNIGNVTVKSGASWTMDSTNIFVDPSFASAGGTTFFPVTLLDAGDLTFGGKEYARLTLGNKAQLTVTKGGVLTPAYASQAIYAPAGVSSPTVVTDGQITAAGNQGIRLDDGGSVTNQADGVISAHDSGVLIQNAKGTVTNSGLIKSDITYGIALGAGGTVTNTGGTIMGTLGVGIYGGAGSVTNTGQITGSSDVGVKLKAGGTVTNTGGTIKGTLGVGIYGGAGIVTNTGRIAGSGSNDGVELKAGGTVINQAGTIIGLGGIFITGGAGTVTNYGQITGTEIYSVNLSPGFANRLRIKPGASFSGSFVNGGNTAGATSLSTIELLSAASAGTINGIGSQYKFFSDITVDSGATWTIGPSGSIAAYQTLVDSGTVINEVFVASEVTLANGTFINASGYLSGADGVSGLSGTNVVVNNSNIRATEIGVSLATAGRVTNQSDGFIGGRLGVYIGQEAGASVVNQGLIEGYLAVYLPKGGSVDNQGGFISGRVGVVISGGNGTVRNAGTIVSVGDYGVILPDHGADRLVLVPGSTIDGLVHGGLAGTGTSFSSLELAAGTSAGTIAGIGSKYLNFRAITVDPDAAWIFAPGQTIAANQALYDEGTLTNSATVLTVIQLGAGAALTNAIGGTVSGSLPVVASDGLASPATVVNYGLIDGGANGYGVELLSFGSVTNRVGTIKGREGVVFGGAGMLTNTGSIVGSSGIAVSFLLGFQNRVAMSPGAVFSGTVDGGNKSAAGTAISTLELMTGAGAGTLSGVGSQYVNFQNFQVDSGAAWALAAGQTIQATYTFTDDGTLTNNATMLTGVTLGAGASVTNAAGATISSASDGVLALGSAATVVNSGTLHGDLLGVSLIGAGAAVINRSGIISGDGDGVTIAGGVGTVTNYGQVLGGAIGVALSEGGTVINRSGAILGILFAGVDIAGGAGTVANYATIGAGGGPAVLLAAGLQNRVIAGPGAVFDGTVNAGGGVLELASGSSAGTVTGIGSHYTGFNHVVVDPGAAWTLASGTLAGAAGAYLTDNGTLTNDATVLIEIHALGAGLTNASGGTISASRAVLMTDNSTIVNYGLIDGVASSYGVELLDGGSVTNLAGTITGSKGVVVFNDGGTIRNTGTIVGSSGTAVALSSNYQNLVAIGPGAVFAGTVNGGNPIGNGFVSTLELMSAASAGTIGTVGVIGAQYVNFADIAVDRGASWVFQAAQTLAANETFTDSGTLTNNGIVLTQVTLGAGATVINADGGQINVTTVSYAYVVRDIAAGLVVNDGLIAGGTHNGGVGLYAGGSVTNLAHGTITAFFSGVGIFGAPGTVINDGVIHGNYGGVNLLGGGTVVNFATISGGTAARAVYLAPSYTARVVIGAGAVFTGPVYSGNTIGSTVVSTLELTTGASAGVIGTIGGIGSQYVNFADIVVDPGASWVFAGNQSLVAGVTLTNAGTLSILHGSLSDAAGIVNNSLIEVDAEGALTLGSLRGTGLVQIGAGGTLTVTGAVASTEAIELEPGGVMNIDGTVTNAGTIAQAGFANGVTFNAGGSVTNLSTGTISGGANGIEITGGGSVTNLSSGVIAGHEGGVVISQLPGTLINAGAVTGATQYGVFFLAGGTVDNQSDAASISGGIDGVYIKGGAGTVTNAGVVSGSVSGVVLVGGGGVVNQGGGTIHGAHDGIYIKGGAGTITDAGIINGPTEAVKFVAGFANRVIIDPGAVFVGTVDGGNTIGATAASMLEFASGATQGLMSGLGTQFIDFARITVDAGALWTLDGANTLAAGTTLTNAGVLTILDGSLADAGRVINNGLIEDDPSTMTLGTLTGIGQVLIGDGSTLTVSGTVAVGETIGFAGTGLLQIAPATFDGQIDGLGAGGRIELTGITDATLASVINGNTLAIQQSTGPTLDLTLDPTQSYAGAVLPIVTLNGNQFVEEASPTRPTVIDQGETETVTGTAGSTMAAITGASGGITVTGAKSLLTTTTGPLIVGDGGLGGLSIEAGGSVTTSLGSVPGPVAAVVANQSGSDGSSVNVTGAGSDWQVNGALVVGDADTGLLAITNGATVSATTLDVGDQISCAGVVTLSGLEADLITTGTVTIGDAGSGELAILNGANATIGGDLNVANAGTGTGNVDIEDTTGTITFGGNILVGFNGFGVFNVGFNVDYIQNNGGIIFGPDSSGAINSFADPSPFLSNSSPSPISIGAQGVDQLAAYLFNSGEFTIPNNHSLTFDTPIIYGGGSFALGSGDNMVLNADTVTGQTFTLGSNDKLTIGIDQLSTIDLPASGTGPFTPESNPNKGDLLLGNFGGVIANFSPGDTIDVDTYLSSAAAGTLSQNGSVVSVIEIDNGATLGVLRFDTAANATAAIADDAITLVPCFAAGTRISTEHGEVAVEAIGVGDRVRVLLGGGAADDGFSEVIWVGRREVHCAGHAQPRKVWPVRVAAGAFGPGRPRTDLFLSPDHAVYVNDGLIPIRHLINGSTIAQVTVDRVTYHHVELAEHDVLLAEGLPAESFLDMRDGSKYANRPGPTRLYPDYSARIWEAFGCAPLVVTGPELVAARALVTGCAGERKAA